MNATSSTLAALWLAAVGLGAPEAASAQPAPAPATPVERPLSGARQTCSATNPAHTQRCSIACEPGESADCEDSDGFGSPTCQCGR